MPALTLYHLPGSCSRVGVAMRDIAKGDHDLSPIYGRSRRLTSKSINAMYLDRGVGVMCKGSFDAGPCPGLERFERASAAVSARMRQQGIERRLLAETGL